MSNMTRRLFLQGGGISMILCALPQLGKAEARWIELTHHSLNLVPNPRQRLRVLHLADFHFSPTNPKELLEDAFSLGLNGRPDIAVITGDFINGRIYNEETYRTTLKKLSRKVPTFASLGNHDGGKWSREVGHGYTSTEAIREFLASADISCLHNERFHLSLGDRAVELVGVADQWSGEVDLERAFHNVSINGDTPTVVLGHNPDMKDEMREHPWQLLLCGHTHGGQFRMPFSHEVFFAPIGDRRYVAGLVRWGKRWVFTNRGLGSVFGMRLNCRPEVTLLDLWI